jgi:hypothetical protein
VAEPPRAAPRRAAALLLSGAPAVGGCPPGVEPGAFAQALAEDVADLITELPGLDPVIGYPPEQQAVAEAVSWPGTRLVPLPPGGAALALLTALGDLGYDEAALIAPDVPDLPGLLVAKVFSGLAGALVGIVPALPTGRLDLPPLTRIPAAAGSASRPTGWPSGSPDGSPDEPAGGLTDEPVGGLTDEPGSGLTDEPGSGLTGGPAGRPTGAVADGPTGSADGLTEGLAVFGCRLPVPLWLQAGLADLDALDAVGRLRAAAPRRRDLVVAPAWRRLRAPADLAGLDPGLEGWEATRALLTGR